MEQYPQRRHDWSRESLEHKPSIWPAIGLLVGPAILITLVVVAFAKAW